MRVDNNGIHASPNAGLTKTGEARKTDKSEKSEKASGSDSKVEARSTGDAKTEISSKARDLAQAKAVATAAPETREDKIAELKRRIEAGEYHTDHHAIADRLVDDHLKMSGIG